MLDYAEAVWGGLLVWVFFGAWVGVDGLGRMLRQASSLFGDGGSLDLSSGVKFLGMEPGGAGIGGPISDELRGRRLVLETYLGI